MPGGQRETGDRKKQRREMFDAELAGDMTASMEFQGMQSGKTRHAGTAYSAAPAIRHIQEADFIE
jgi:hypothetical protein